MTPSRYFAEIISISNTSVALGGMVGGMPPAP
jgi:hypothetical protein